MSHSINPIYLYLLSPLHTGGTTQEGNLLGIARESHTDLPYIPSSTIRGRLRSLVGDDRRIQRIQLFGPDLKDVQEFADQYEQETGNKLTQLEQGKIWIGDASLLWMPVPSLSHGVVWISSPLLLERWARFQPDAPKIPGVYSTNLPAGSPVYLKDAILKTEDLHHCQFEAFGIPQHPAAQSLKKVLVLPEQHCNTLIQMSLWRQVKVKLDSHKSVEGGFRYEEAIPPDTLMYLPWGVTAQTNGKGKSAEQSSKEAEQSYQQLFTNMLREKDNEVLQIGGQESLGRGFVQPWLANNASGKEEN